MKSRTYSVATGSEAVITRRAEGMTQEEYRALRREADRKLKFRLRYGTIIYMASELFSENGIDMIRRFKPYRRPSKSAAVKLESMRKGKNMRTRLELKLIPYICSRNVSVAFLNVNKHLLAYFFLRSRSRGGGFFY